MRIHVEFKLYEDESLSVPVEPTEDTANNQEVEEMLLGAVHTLNANGVLCAQEVYLYGYCCTAASDESHQKTLKDLFESYRRGAWQTDAGLWAVLEGRLE